MRDTPAKSIDPEFCYHCKKPFILEQGHKKSKTTHETPVYYYRDYPEKDWYYFEQGAEFPLEDCPDKDKHGFLRRWDYDLAVQSILAGMKGFSYTS